MTATTATSEITASMATTGPADTPSRVNGT
jgi:hypothetical protein